MFSKACEYAIKATIFIAGQSMQNKKTTRNKVVSADKGPNGGFYLTKNQLQNICLKHIVEVIDGNSLFENCGLGLNKCNDKKPCPVHNKFKLVKEGILEMLESTTVQFMAIQMKKGKTFLKI